MEPIEHEEAVVRRGTRSGLYTVVAVHSTVRGPATGGCRLWHYPDVYAALDDALRLSRAMTFKSAVAGLPLGGGKSVIVVPEGDELTPARRKNALLDVGETIDLLKGRYVTAEDVGTSSRDMSVIAGVTTHVAGLSRQKGGSGDPSPFTATGVVSAIRATAQRQFGSCDLSGRSVSVIGAGHVGGRIARTLAKEGAKLIIADVDASKRALASDLGARWMSPAKALTAKVDILAPCALGGVLNAQTVPELRCRVIAGAANNQLADDAIAVMLRAREILWAPDFVANAGGIINIAEERRPGGYDAASANAAVAGIADTLGRIFDTAESDGITTLEAAMKLAREALARPRATRSPTNRSRASRSPRATAPRTARPRPSRA